MFAFLMLADVRVCVTIKLTEYTLVISLSPMPETQLNGSVKELNKSTSMKLRKSLVKSVMWQNISSCSVLPPEIVMHDAFNVIL